MAIPPLAVQSSPRKMDIRRNDDGSFDMYLHGFVYAGITPHRFRADFKGIEEGSIDQQPDMVQNLIEQYNDQAAILNP